MTDIINATVAGLRGPAAIVTPDFQALHDQTVAAEAGAQTAQAGAVAALQSLYAPSQVIGRTTTSPIDGSVASNVSYVLDSPVAVAGLLTQLTIFPHSVGTVQIARYTRSGSSAPYTFTRQALSNVFTVTSAMVSAGVAINITASDLGTFQVNAGDYIAVYANGVLTFTTTTTDLIAWYSLAAGLPASASASTSATARLEVAYQISTQNVTGSALASLQASASANAIAVANLSGPTTQVIGRLPNWTIQAGNAVGGSLYTPAVPVFAPGSLFVEFWALNTNPVKLTRQVISGSTSTVVSSYSYTPVVGYNSFTLTQAQFPFNAGDYLGMSGSGTLGYLGSNPSAGIPSDIPYYSVANATNGGAIGASSTANNFMFRLTITPTANQQVVNYANFASVKASAQPLSGKKIGFMGDSLTASFNQLWQSALAARTGATLWRQDARGGRAFSAQLEAFGCPSPLANLSSIGSYAGANPASGNLNSVSGNPVSQYNRYYQVPADGTTLAQWLADLDLLIIWLGTNDANALTNPSTGTDYVNGIGTLTDAYTAKTFHGAMNWVLDAVLTAKPSQRIMGVDLYQSATGSAANIAAVQAGLKANYEARSIPLLEASKKWGINSRSSGTLLRADGIHLTDDSFTRIAGPSIAEFARQLL